jgi:hypothetical protein
VRLSCAKVRDAEEFPPRVVHLERIDGTLVACEGVSTEEATFQAVAEYREQHPNASQNEVEKAITGRTDTKRAAYRQLFKGAPSAPNPVGAAPDKMRPRAPSFKRGAVESHDPDIEDGGW